MPKTITRQDLRFRMGEKRINAPSETCNHRSPFQLDVGKVTFSDWFRLLSDKTQVHGLSGTTTTRSRLTHSLEVARIAESIGRSVVRALPGEDDQLIEDVGNTLHAAALLHDIGNPPFGHNGEIDISRFYYKSTFGRQMIRNLPPQWRAQFRHFEGNSQALRYALNIGGTGPSGSLGLTSATLSAFCKYPWSVNPLVALDADFRYKYGINIEDENSYAEIAKDCNTQMQGEKKWARHPLAYISEAADDIAYGVADIEDAFRLNLITLTEAQDLLFPLLNNDQIAFSKSIDDPRKRMMWIRGEAIGVLVDEVTRYITENIETIMDGSHPYDIVRSFSNYAEQMKRISIFSSANIYCHHNRLEQDKQASIAIDYITARISSELYRHEKIGAPIRSEVLDAAGLSHAPLKRIEWMLAMNDMIAAQTDRSLLALWETLKNIA